MPAAFSPAAAAEIAKLLVNSDFPCRYGMLERLIDDLKSKTNGGQITGQFLRKLKANGNTPQSLMETARVG